MKRNRKSLRLQNYNYSHPGYYFVTICTKKMVHCLGYVQNGEMHLSEIGEIIKNEWVRTGTIRTNVELDQWVIMPNHIHGIIIINNDNNIVGTHCSASLHVLDYYKNHFGPQRNNLSSIIRGFKSATTNQIHQLGYSNFRWQPRFHDHIIRNIQSLDHIRSYIMNNPEKWYMDEYNTEKQK